MTAPPQSMAADPASGVHPAAMPAHAPPAAGNAVQLDLRDIHVPGAPPVWPPAPGWWLLGAVVLAGLAVIALRLLEHRRARRRRERLIAELDGLLDTARAERCSPALLGAVSALLKRAALRCFPRTEVASLTGPDWLAFLDRTGGGGGFAAGPGRALAYGAYAPERDCDAAAVIELARRWLRQNL